MIETSKKPNGHGEYQPEKVWDRLNDKDPDSWLENQPEVPGQERIINLETLKEELLDEEDQEDVTN